MFYSKPLEQVMRENFSYDQLNKFALAMESESVSTDVMSQAFNAILGGMTSFVREVISPRKIDKAIEDSHGDITKVKNLEISLKLLKLLAKDKDKEVSKYAKVIQAHYNYIKAHKVEYMKAYQMAGKISGMFIWATYVCEVLNIVLATSQLTMYQAGQSKKIGENIRAEETWVNYYKDGSMDKYYNFFLNKKSEVKEEAAIIVTALVLGTVITVAMFLRVFVFYFYYLRMELSDYFMQQSDYLSIHAGEIKKKALMSNKEKEEVIKNQKAWADRFMELSDMIADKDLVAKRKAKSLITHSNKEVNPSTVSVPNTGMDFL